MKRLLWLNSTLLLGTSGASLWLLVQIVKFDRILLGEPNPHILAGEVWLFSCCLIAALLGLVYLLVHVVSGKWTETKGVKPE